MLVFNSFVVVHVTPEDIIEEDNNIDYEECNVASEKTKVTKTGKKRLREENAAEENRERRHRERLALQKEAIDVYKETMSKLIDKL